MPKPSSTRTPTKRYISKYDDVRYAFIREQSKWHLERRVTRKLLKDLDISIVSEIVIKHDYWNDWHSLVVTLDDDIPIVLRFRGYRNKVWIEGAYEFVDFTKSGNIIFNERRPLYYDCR